MTVLELVREYLWEIDEEWDGYCEGNNAADIYRVIRKGIRVIGKEVGLTESDFSWHEWSMQEDKEIFVDKLQRYETESKKGLSILSSLGITIIALVGLGLVFYVLRKISDI